MGLTSESAFVSLMQHRDDTTKLQLRARVAADIKAKIPGAEVSILPGADYRARVGRQEAAQKLADGDKDDNMHAHDSRWRR